MKRSFVLLFLLAGAATLHAETNTQNLNVLRAALAVYYGDTEGLYPTDFALLSPRYLSVVPVAQCDNGSSNRVTNFSAAAPDNSGGWGYVNISSSVQWGQIFLNCISTDSPIKADPSQNEAKLNTLRSALSIYYGDTEGAYPPSLQALTPKYIAEIPEVVCHGQASNDVHDFSAVAPDDAGGWGYIGNMLNPSWGEVFINCKAQQPTPSHRPSRGPHPHNKADHQPR